MTSSLTDHLRSLPDDDLSSLFRLRPDLVVPIPSDFSVLEERARSRLSVARALDGLDRFTLHILDALRLTCDGDTASVPTVLEMTTAYGLPSSDVLSAIEVLRQRLLIYGDHTEPRVVEAIEEVSSPYPAGLGRLAIDLSPEAAHLASDPARLRRTLLAAPAPARAALNRLAEGPPIGTVSPASLAAGSDSALRWLLDVHLLVQISEDTVELPREMGLLLRRDIGPLGQWEPTGPVVATAQVNVDTVDRAAAGQALEATRQVEALLESLSAEPSAILRSGGMGVRDMRRLARACGVTDRIAATLVETAYAAGLLGESSSDVGYERYLPTVAYDGWRASGIAVRWERLVSAWLGMTRESSLIGNRNERRIVNALSQEVERSGAPGRRRAALQVLADQPQGTSIGPEGVASIVEWRAPRRATRSSSSATTDVITEATALGLCAMGALPSFARLLLAEEPPDDRDLDPLGVTDMDRPGQAGAIKALDELLPNPVDHFLVQADQTVVVPGPPEPVLAAELAVIADQESPSTYRITADSVRRSLDTGLTGQELQALLVRRSRKPIPQPVSYLIDDVARAHGGLRAGTAGSYLRSDDEALIAEILAHRKLAVLGLRRLASTVLVARCSNAKLMAALREAGYAPVAEDASGEAVLLQPRRCRAPARSMVPVRTHEDPFASHRWSSARLAGIVEQIRHSDAAARLARRAPDSVRTASTGGADAARAQTEALAVIQQALQNRVAVWIGYVDAHGTSMSRLLHPVSMGGGYLRATDERTDTLHTFALHRITAAAFDLPGSAK